MAFKNIIFDIDGTLVNGFNASNLAFKNALKQVTGTDYDEETLSLHFGIPIARFFELINVEYTKELEDVLNKEFDHHDKKTEIFPNIEQLLNTLKDNNIRLGIVTSRNKADWPNFEEYGLTKYFEQFVVADDTIYHKPHPEPMYKILQLMNLNKEETIYIGDTIYDQQCANSAGVKFGVAKWGARDKSLTGDYEFNDPLDILEIINK